MASSYKLWIPLLLFCLTIGCGDIEGQLASIIVSPSSATVGIGKTQYFTAVGKDSVGKIVQVSPTWSVEGSIGTISSSGLFTANPVEGTGYVVATSGSISGKASVTVTAKGWLEGKVTDANLARVRGIYVYLKERPTLTDDTDVNGDYSIPGIPAGTYEARIDATTYYQEATKEVTIVSGEVTPWSPILQIQPGAPTVPTTTLFTP